MTIIHGGVCKSVKNKCFRILLDRLFRFDIFIEECRSLQLSPRWLFIRRHPHIPILTPHIQILLFPMYFNLPYFPLPLHRLLPKPKNHAHIIEIHTRCFQRPTPIINFVCWSIEIEFIVFHDWCLGFLRLGLGFAWSEGLQFEEDLGEVLGGDV